MNNAPMSLPSLLRLLSLAALWGGSFVFLRVAAPVFDAVPTAFGRALFSALGLLALLALLRLRPRFAGKLGVLLVLGLVNMGAPFLLLSWAARVLPAGYNALLNGTTPLMGALVGALFFGERLGPARMLGIALGLAGVAALAQVGPVALTRAVLLGIAAGLLASLCYGTAAFLARRWITARGGLDNRVAAFGSQCGAVLGLLPFLAWHLWRAPDAPQHWLAAPPVTWAALLALGLLCTALAYILYYRLLADVGPIKTLMVPFLVPLFGVVWARLLLGEAVTLGHVVGGALIGLALWLVAVRG